MASCHAIDPVIFKEAALLGKVFANFLRRARTGNCQFGWIALQRIPAGLIALFLAIIAYIVEGIGAGGWLVADSRARLVAARAFRINFGRGQFDDFPCSLIPKLAAVAGLDRGTGCLYIKNWMMWTLRWSNSWSRRAGSA